MSICAPFVSVPGISGNSAFAFVTQNFTVPTIGANVQIQLSNTASFVAGQNIIIAAPANFQIVSVDNSFQITAMFLGLTGDVAAATVISLGAEVSPTGRPGTNGTAGQNGFAITTSAFTVPSIGATVTVPVDDSGAFVVGEYAIATGPANFKVSAVPNATSITLLFLDNTGDVSPGATVPLGSTIAPSGSAGQSAFTKLTAQLTVPAIGATVTAAVLSTAWMATGQNVVIAAPASFQVTTINSLTSVTLTFLGYFGDVVPSTVIAGGTIVTPTGTQPAAGSTVTAFQGSPFTIPQNASPQPTGITITIPAAGTWRLTAIVNLQGNSTYNGAASVNGLILQFYRTNNSPTAVGNNTTFYLTEASVGWQQTFGILPMELANYSAAAGDTISIYAAYPTALQAGALLAASISLTAQQIG